MTSIRHSRLRQCLGSIATYIGGIRTITFQHAIPACVVQHPPSGVELGTTVTPETLLAWHRRLIAQKYDGSEKPGRPRTAEEVKALIVRIANENRTWGYRRIQAALANLGYDIGRGTIADILTRNGIEPAPVRERKITWKESTGSDRSGGLLYNRSLDAAWTAEVHRVISHRVVYEEGLLTPLGNEHAAGWHMLLQNPNESYP